MHLLLDVAICVIGLFLIGYPLARNNSAIEGSERLPWALILGICITIVLVRSVNTVAPIGRASPWIAAGLGGWLAYSWRQKTIRDLFLCDLRALDPFMSAAWLTALTALILGLNIPTLSHHALVAEASPNHDAIYYVTNARWMLGHRFGEVVTYSAAHPLFWLTRSSFGSAPQLGRVGAESLLAFVSGVSAQDPLANFQALQTVAMIGGISASALLVPRRLALFSSHPTAATVLAIGALVFAPSFIQIAINSSFPNAYGVVLMTSFVMISVRSKAWTLGAQQPLLFAGMLATYPELSPITLATICSIFLFELVLRHRSFRSLLMSGLQILTSAALAILAMPWISSVAALTLKTVYFVASTQGNSWPDPYAGLSALQLPLAVFSTSKTLATLVPGAVFVGFTGIFCVALARSVRRAQDKTLPLGIALALGFFLSYIFHKDFNYGKLKILEYFSLFLSPSLIVACMSVSRDKHRMFDCMLQYLVLLGVAAMNVSACYLLLHKGAITSGRRYIATDFVNAVRAADAWSGKRSIAVRFGTEPFLYSMWAAYISSRPVEFSPNYGSGGYLGSFASTHPAVPQGSSNIVVADNIGSSSLFGEEVLGSYGRFKVFDLANGGSVSAHGLYGDEGGWSWMGKQLVLKVFGANVRFLSLALSHRFAPQFSHEKVRLTIDDTQCEFTISTHSQVLTIALPPTSPKSVTLEPLGRVVSPEQLGQSADGRLLSYQVFDLKLAAKPPSPPITCGNDS